MLTSKAFGKRKDDSQQKGHEMKTFEWIVFKNPLEAWGATQIGCTFGAPNESSFQVKIMLTSKAYGKIKSKADLQQSASGK
jgi:hypothetical protein